PLRQKRQTGSQARPRDRVRRGRRAPPDPRAPGSRDPPGRLSDRSEAVNNGHSQGQPRVGIVMGSDSDWPVMEAAAEALGEFDVEFEVIIAGAGGAAHLPGMLAAVTPLPVIG